MLNLHIKLIVLTIVILLIDSKNLLRPVKDLVVNVSLPFEAGLLHLGNSVSSEAKFWSNLLAVKDENVRLGKKIEDLEGFILKLKDVERENQLLKDQLKVKSVRIGESFVIGKVLGKVSDKPTTVLVNLGKNSSIKKGNLVVYKNYVFGKIAEVGTYSSRVDLLTNPESLFDGTDIDRDGAKGEVRGDFGTSLKMEKILPTERVAVGDTVVDSKSGYILGKVARVDAESAGILKTADLLVSYELEKVEKVFVYLSD